MSNQDCLIVIAFRTLLLNFEKEKRTKLNLYLHLMTHAYVHLDMNAIKIWLYLYGVINTTVQQRAI